MHFQFGGNPSAVSTWRLLGKNFPNFYWNIFACLASERIGRALMQNSSLHCLLQHSVEVQYISWQPDLLKAVGKVHVKIVTLPFELLLCREVFIFWEPKLSWGQTTSRSCFSEQVKILKLKCVLQVWQKSGEFIHLLSKKSKLLLV